jgi:mannose-6-phosphate isomerase-like protein (cupin superfamily)
MGPPEMIDYVTRCSKALSFVSILSTVVLGMGLSSALSYEARRRRIWERVHVVVFSWLQQSSALVLGKYRKPTPSDIVEGTPMTDPSDENDSKSAPCGVRREVVSPDWCFTSTMSVTILTLHAGSELVPQTSVGVEFYYVLKGEGVYIRGEGSDKEVMKLTPDSCLVVDPFR